MNVGDPTPAAGPAPEDEPAAAELPDDAGDDAGEGEAAEEGDAGDDAALPPLADALMAPLLDAAGDVLRRMKPADTPPAARRLRSFDRRGLATPAARRQLRRLLAEDEELLGSAATLLLGRPEAARLAQAWEEAMAAGGGAPLALVDEVSADGRLPLLASVLASALPAGFEFGLGLVVAMAAGADREADAARTARAATTARAAAEEAHRRADAARTRAVADRARLERTLREEREARRAVERHAAETGALEAGLQVALSEAEARAAAAEQRASAAEERLASAEKRALTAEQRLVAAEGRAAEAEHRLVAAEGRAAEAEHRLAAGPSGPGEPRLDPALLDEAVQAAEDLARTLRRAALGNLAPASPVSEPQPSRPRPAATRVKRQATPVRRAAVTIPPGMQQDDPAAVAAMVRTPGVAIIVDGYNVSMLAWPGMSAADQRERLCDALAEFQLRIRREVTVVFDGADVPGVRPLRRREIRIVFSAAGQEADNVIVDEVVFRPAEVPVVVVTSDRAVQAAAVAEGAAVLPSDRFLRLLGR